MRTRDRPERGDQHDEDRPRRERVPQQGQGDVAAGEALTHDARADDGCQQQAGAQRLRRDPLRAHATFGFDEVLPSMQPMSCRWRVIAIRFSDVTGNATSSEMRFLR